jgi:hypothetical protein
MRFVAVVGIVLLGYGAAVAAEGGAAAGTGSAIQLNTQSLLDVGDVPGHQLAQALGEDELKTPDKIGGVPFDGAKVHIFRQSDLVKGSGVVRGYAVWEAKSGEKLYVIFGYSVPPYPPGKDIVPFEGTFQWIGGSGTLERIVGKGTIEGEISPRGEARYRWAGSYEKAAK